MKLLNSTNNITAVRRLINSILIRNISNLSKMTGFTKRIDAKLLPETFVRALTLGLINTPSPTLQNIAYACENFQNDLCISKEAIYQKLKVGLELLKEVFKESLKCSLDLSVEACQIEQFRQFNNVYICDSTGISVPEKLLPKYYGSGGYIKKGELNIQTMFSLVSRSVKYAKIIPGHVNDTLYTKKIAEHLNENDLVMFDMGYRDRAGYKKITEKKAFYLTRVTVNTKYYNLEATNKYPNWREEIDILEKLKESKTGIVDIDVLMGSKPDTRVKCRFVAIKLPEKIANERIRKTLKKRKKPSLTTREMEFLKWNTFITNVPAKMLPVESIYNMYMMRWQIELVFKAFKSFLNLDELSNVGENQLNCILYGRLITATLMSSLYSQSYAIIFSKKKREISILKYFNYIRNKSNEFIANILNYQGKFDKLLGFLEKAAHKSLYEKRTRQSSLDNLIKSSFFDLPKTG